MPVSERPAILSRIAAALSTVAALALAVLVGAAMPAVAEGPPKGMRAPDAWGAVLPVAPGREPSIWEVFFDHDGRLIIHYYYAIDPNLPTYSWIGRLYDLAARRVVAETVIPYSEPEAVGKEKSRQWEASVARRRAEKAFEYNLSSVEPAKLLSEEAWLWETEGLRMSFSVLYLDWTLRKTDQAGKEIFNVMILYTPQDNSRRRFRRGPWREEGPEEVFVRTRAFLPTVYDLKDGTYLLTGSEEPVVIRYYGNLQSPYLDASDELLVLDLAQAEPMITETIERAEAVVGYSSRAEEFWDVFEVLLTERVRALITAKRKKN